MGEEATVAPALPKKRSLFSKAAAAKAAESEEAIDFFSRAKELYPQRLEEEERRREKKLIKLERKKSSASPDVQVTTPPEGKRRRVSPQGKDVYGNSSGSSGDYEYEGPMSGKPK